MTISSVTEMWSRQVGQQESQDGRSFQARYARAFQIEHSADETLFNILEASDGTTSVPRLGDLYPGTTAIYCTRIGQPERVGPTFTIVPVEYFGELGSADPTNDPLNKPPEIIFLSRTSTEPIDTDRNGFPLTTTAGEPVNGIQEEIWDYELRVRRNFAAFSTYALRLYAQSYSSDVFWDGWPAGTAKLDGFSARPVYISGVVAYYDVEATIIFREPINTVPSRAWWKRYRNEGYYERTGTSVTFSGGGGSGASAYAVTSASGAVTAIVVTNRGQGYSSPPTVVIESTTGGSGATATATLNSNGLVTGVSVTSPGSGYKSRIERAVDDRKVEFTSPVLLKANGEREKNAANAFFCEAETRRPMPYGALGLV